MIYNILLYILYGVSLSFGFLIGLLFIKIIKIFYKEISFYIAWIKHYFK
jgi:hypothetical protein